MLKLSYYGENNSTKNNIAHRLYLELKKRFLNGTVGYIFNLYCKYNSIGVRRSKRQDKINPLRRTKRILEDYHLRKNEKMLVSLALSKQNSHSCSTKKNTLCSKNLIVFEESFILSLFNTDQFSFEEHKDVSKMKEGK